MAEKWIEESKSLLVKLGRNRTRAFGWLLGMQSDLVLGGGEDLLLEAAHIMEDYPAIEGSFAYTTSLISLCLCQNPPRIDRARKYLSDFERIANNSGSVFHVAYCHVMKGIIFIIEYKNRNAKEQIKIANTFLSDSLGRSVTLTKDSPLIQYCLTGFEPLTDRILAVL